MRSLLCCLTLLVAANVFGETEYWVSVASSEDLLVAEDIQRDAGERFSEVFTLQPADTAKGFFYRVVSGPFMSIEVARELQQRARADGYPAAWVLQTERAPWEFGIETEQSPDGFADEESPGTQPDGDIAPPALDLPAADPEKTPLPKLIDEPPPGYQLNKLNRDQAALDFASPYLLAASGLSSVVSAALAAQESFGAGIDVTPEETSIREDAETLTAIEAALAAGKRVPSAAGVEVDFHTGDTLVLREWDHSEAAIRIDGVLDELPWRQALPVSLMKVVEPETLDNPRYDTAVRMFYTKRGIYVSFDMEQPADTLVKRLSSRDEGRLNRDYVSFTLDTSGKGLYAYWMNLALGDNQVDGTALPERQYSRNWDGAWYGGTAETANGWSAEYFIPWSQMTMPSSDGVRRLGFYSSRQVAHLNQKWGWPPYPRSQAKFMSVLQPLEVQGIDPRQQWSFFPYASTTVDEVDNKSKYKSGFDLFWRPSTNLQLTATVNPDFGTVEADDVVVNLSAFETFFPEKRLFFLEGREIFQETPKAGSGDGGTPITLLNTRRIGSRPIPPEEALEFDFIDRETDQLTELYGAAKVTGQIGRFRYGAMTAFEQDTDLRAIDGTKFTAEGRDYGIARVLYENTAGGEYRALGVMSTVTTHTTRDAYTNGLDYHYLSATGKWKLDGLFMQSHRDGDGYGYGGFATMVYTPRLGLSHVFELTHFDDHLEINDLGFLERNDVSGFRYGAEWVKTGLTRIRDFRVEPFVRYEENGEGEAVRSGLGVVSEFKLNNLDQINAAVKYFPERYDDRNSFGNGTFKIQDRAAFELGYSTDSAKKFSYFANAKWEEDGIDGDWYETRAGLAWRPIDQINVEVSTSYKVRDGWLLHTEGRNMTSYESEQWGPKVELEYFLTAKQDLKMLFQWVGIKAFEDKFYRIPEDSNNLIEIDKPDDDSDSFAVSSLNFQLRYRWQIAPLSDLFVVYSKVADEKLPIDSFSNVFEETWQDPLFNQLVVKLRYRVGT